MCDSPKVYRRRVLCILPDLYLTTKAYLRYFALIWPPADAEDSEVKVLAVPQEIQFTAIIRTGIQSADLLGGDEWQQISPDTSDVVIPRANAHSTIGPAMIGIEPILNPS